MLVILASRAFTYLDSGKTENEVVKDDRMANDEQLQEGLTSILQKRNE
jgi:hypothetical protein